MKVKDLIASKGKEVISLDADDTVEDAIRTMSGRTISAVIVTHNGRPAGIFTERDVLRCYIAWPEVPFKEIPLKEAMVIDLVVAEPEDDLCEVMWVMIHENIRHLPVTEHGKIVGILSVRDIIQTQVGNLAGEIHHLRDYIADLHDIEAEYGAGEPRK